MFVNTNLSAMNTWRHLFKTNSLLDKSLERLSSGLRINSGADDPSGLAMVEKMLAQEAGLTTALQNVQDGQALLKTADGALSQIGSMLTRMEELAVRAANGTLTDSDREALTDELNELRNEINDISGGTEYNTIKLLNGSLAVSATVSGNDNLQITNRPYAMRSGDVSFHLTQTASAAVFTGAAIGTATLSAGVTASGTITINGSEISISSGDSVEAIIGKINAVNDSTNVVATLDADGNQINLVSGLVDDDAQNLVSTNVSWQDKIVGFALQGEQYSITISGGALLASIGLSATSVTGRNAAGSMNGVAMKASGSYLEVTEFGSLAYGMKINTDTTNGGNGVYIRDDADPGSGMLTHASNDNDTATIKLDGSRALQLQAGANYSQSVLSAIAGVSTSQLGFGGSAKFINLADINFDSAENAGYALKTIQQSIVDVANRRSRIGAGINRLDYTIDTLGIQRENLTDAASRLQDADLTWEMTQYTRQSIMLQVGAAMLAQANTRAQTVLQLLQ